MSNDIPSDLSDKIANGLCVLFIGAGATCDSGGKLWKGLVSELKKRFKNKVAHPDPDLRPEFNDENEGWHQI